MKALGGLFAGHDEAVYDGLLRANTDIDRRCGRSRCRDRGDRGSWTNVRSVNAVLETSKPVQKASIRTAKDEDVS